MRRTSAQSGTVSSKRPSLLYNCLRSTRVWYYTKRSRFPPGGEATPLFSYFLLIYENWLLFVRNSTTSSSALPEKFGNLILLYCCVCDMWLCLNVCESDATWSAHCFINWLFCSASTRPKSSKLKSSPGIAEIALVSEIGSLSLTTPSLFTIAIPLRVSYDRVRRWMLKIVFGSSRHEIYPPGFHSVSFWRFSSFSFGF